MKTVYLMRHGAYSGSSLNQTGINQIKSSGEALKEEISEEVVKIFYSPLTRARESAQILAETLAPKITLLEERDELACDNHSIARVVQDIEKLGIIVSHQPDLESFIHKIGQCGYFSTGSYKRVEII